MNKVMLLAGASIVVLSTVVQAMGPEDIREYAGSNSHHVSISNKPKQEKLSAKDIVDFTRFSYSVAKTGWKQEDKAIFNKLINEGWKLDVFEGTTGSAANQVGSVSGLLAFKDDHVVIATRGTQMLNGADWQTNTRLYSSPYRKFLGLFSKNEAEKERAIGAQNFGGVSGEAAGGFLQTHLSSWDYIKNAILQHAKATGKSTQDFHYTVTGHSQGGAKAQLNALGLLTDRDLDIGTHTLEKSGIGFAADTQEIDPLKRSFIASNKEVDGIEDLGKSGFYGVAQDNLELSGFYGTAKTTESKNEDNVDIVVFESPGVVSQEMAKNMDAIMGKSNLLRIENSFDPVPQVGLYGRAGTEAKINAIGLNPHGMGTIAPPVLKDNVIDNHRAKVAAEKAAATKAAQPSKTATQSVSKGGVIASLKADAKAFIGHSKSVLRSVKNLFGF